MLIFHPGEAQETLGLTVIDPIVVLKGVSQVQSSVRAHMNGNTSRIRTFVLCPYWISLSKTFEGLVWFLIQIQYTYVHICTHTIYMFCSPLGPTSSLPHSPLVLTISEVP